jgi:hypothetical protein
MSTSPNAELSSSPALAGAGNESNPASFQARSLRGVGAPVLARGPKFQHLDKQGPGKNAVSPFRKHMASLWRSTTSSLILDVGGSPFRRWL